VPVQALTPTRQPFTGATSYCIIVTVHCYWYSGFRVTVTGTVVSELLLLVQWFQGYCYWYSGFRVTVAGTVVSEFLVPFAHCTLQSLSVSGT